MKRGEEEIDGLTPYGVVTTPRYDQEERRQQTELKIVGNADIIGDNVGGPDRDCKVVNGLKLWKHVVVLHLRLEEGASE